MIDGEHVRLGQMLEAREWRASRQCAFIERHCAPLICLTLNIAGPVKRFPLADRTFACAKRLITQQLGASGIEHELLEQRVDRTGYFAIYGARAEPVFLKHLMSQIEQTHPLGRVFDVDVLDADGAKLSRPDVGLPGRTCLLCGESAHACARNRTHSVEELQRRTLSVMKAYFDAQFCERVQRAALKALLYELSATPKPGLVDRANSGAHGDMDYFRMLDSIAALSHCFHAFAAQGIEASNEAELYNALKAMGQRAEAGMLLATDGVNTHKGALFTLGLIAGASGLLYGRGAALSAESMLDAAAQLARHSLPELVHSRRGAYLQHGAGGARAEAAAGFPSVRDVALPELRRRLDSGCNSDQIYNDAGVSALLELIAHVEDTNLITRKGARVAADVRGEVRAALDGAPDLPARMRAAERLDQQFIQRGLSPGGCADLLAAAWMVHFLCEEGNKSDVD